MMVDDFKTKSVLRKLENKHEGILAMRMLVYCGTFKSIQLDTSKKVVAMCSKKSS